MGQQSVVAHRDTQAGDDVEHGKHRPIQPRISVDQSVAWDDDHRSCDDRPEEEISPELMVDAMNNVDWN